MRFPSAFGIACSNTGFTCSAFCANPGETHKAIAVSTNPSDRVRIAFMASPRIQTQRTDRLTEEAYARAVLGRTYEELYSAGGCLVVALLVTEEQVMTADPISGVRIPDSKLAGEVTQLVRDTESDLLFYHSTRVYFWAALTGKRRDLRFDPELLYTGAMFHDIGLTRGYQGSRLRFEVDGANAARDFLRSHGISERDIETVWTAVALHTTPGIPEHMHPEIALVQAGAGMDAF